MKVAAGLFAVTAAAAVTYAIVSDDPPKKPQFRPASLYGEFRPVKSTYG